MTESADDLQAHDAVPGPRRALRVVSVIVAALALSAGGFVVGRVTAPDAATTSVTVPGSSSGEVDALLARALDYHSKGRVGDAGTLYRRVLEIDPTNRYAHYNLGLIAHTAGDHQQAITEYLAALDTDPGFFSALYNLGLVYAAEDEASLAVEYLQRAVEAEPDSAAAHFNLGRQLTALGRAGEGEVELEKAYELDPSLKP